MNGIINIDKEKGWTSQDVLSKLKNTLKKHGIREKIGHTGTLDPMATGLLTICIGKATRIIEYFDGDIKTYQCTMELGKTSDTLDITGEILSQTDYSNIKILDIRNAFDRYKGVIEQIPPRYSALKYNGKPLYEYARRGIEIDSSIKKRRIYIKDIIITNIDLNHGEIEFEVSCSKGTYIRTICDDIGRELGTGAVMKDLRRISNGIFSLKDAMKIDEISSLSIDKFKSILDSPDKALVNLGSVLIDEEEIIKFINGNFIDKDKYEIIKEPKREYYYEVGDNMFSYKIFNDDTFLGIGKIDDNSALKAKKVIIGYDDI